MAVNLKKRYRVLRIISVIYKIMAVVVLILCIGGAVVSDVWHSPVSKAAVKEATSKLEQEAEQTLKIKPSGRGLLEAIFPTFESLNDLVTGVIFFLALYAFGELISLLIALEENTRKTSLILEEKGQT
jgi:hypothetical protein